jgi:hypothetical protein
MSQGGQNRALLLGLGCRSLECSSHGVIQAEQALLPMLEIHSPPDLMTSLERSVMAMYPCRSTGTNNLCTAALPLTRTVCIRGQAQAMALLPAALNRNDECMGGRVQNSF